MSGRGRGRGSGRRRSTCGRVGKSTDGFYKNLTNKSLKKSLSDYVYYLGSAKQAADYETTTEFLINHIKKTFNFGNDIGTALEELTYFDINVYKPTLMYSISDDDIMIEAENEQFKIEFKAEFDSFMKRKQCLETNTTKAYAFLWDQCAKGMQSKIEARTDYNIKIKNDQLRY